MCNRNFLLAYLNRRTTHNSPQNVQKFKNGGFLLIWVWLKMKDLTRVFSLWSKVSFWYIWATATSLLCGHGRVGGVFWFPLKNIHGGSFDLTSCYFCPRFSHEHTQDFKLGRSTTASSAGTPKKTASALLKGRGDC